MKEKKYTKKEFAYISKLMADGLDRKHAEWYLNIMQTCTKDWVKSQTSTYFCAVLLKKGIS